MKEIVVRIPIALSEYIRTIDEEKEQEAKEEIAYVYRPVFGKEYFYEFDTVN